MTPIFVGGCPRSGTTLLGAMLGAHEGVLCLPESPFIAAEAGAFGTGQSDHSAIAARVHEAIRTSFKFDFWQLSETDLDACRRVDAGDYRELIQAYVDAYAKRAARPQARHWLDHTPENLAFSRRLAAAFPGARFIHIVRDGRAVAASWIPLTWGPNTVSEAARRWMIYLAQGLAAEQALAPATIRRVTYEELVADPDAVLHRLCDWLGLAFRAEMIEGAGFRVPAYTRNQHGLIGQPADRRRIDDWRRKLRPREIEIFEHLSGDLLANLGYQLVSDGGSAAPGYREKLQLEIVEKARQLQHALGEPLRLRRFKVRLRHEKVPSDRGS